jgi:hypothetical protein
VSATAAAGAVRVKAGVQFTTIAPAGFAILGALERAARLCRMDLTITSACDGAHSGAVDPHHRGEAYDIRTHEYPDTVKDAILWHLLELLRTPGEPLAAPVEGIPRSLATSRFFGFLEAPGAPNEHLHIQLRKGRTYP